MIEYKNVALRYTEKDVLRDVNLRIENGEFMVLVGPSGSGKTTMIKMINRLLEPTDGPTKTINSPFSIRKLTSLKTSFSV